MRRLLIGTVVALGFAGCGGEMRQPNVVVVPCAQPPGLAAAPLPQEQGVYRAGRLTLAVGADLAQLPAARSGSDAIAVVRGNRSVKVTVEPGSRSRFSFQFVNGADSTALRFPACGGPLHRFGGGITFAGGGCVRLRVTPGGEMLIPIANSLSGCPGRAGGHRVGLSALPYLGVSCPVGNLITCDRVGIGVSLRQPAVLVTVQVAGRTVTLSPPSDPRSDLWLGYLYDAGLRHGPLRVQAHGDYWYGEPFVTPRIVLAVFFADGTVTEIVGNDQLHAGFG
jgi:hypothetical protein